MDVLHRNGCKLCPLDTAKGLYTPKMEATGADKPLIYILGEAPGRHEDEIGQQFVGASGNLLRPLIPPEFAKKIRYNNTINCRPPDNRNPEKIELECCRPRIVNDIENTKPKAIFGFGNFPLTWTTGQSGIYNWRGRRVPVQIGSHTCWYYPFFHPSLLLRNRRGHAKDRISEDERATQLDLKHAFAEIERLPPPTVHSSEAVRGGITCLVGDRRSDLSTLLAFLKRACEVSYAGVDYETSTKRPYAQEAKIISAAVSTCEETLSFAFDHSEARWSDEAKQQIQDAWIEFLKSPCRKISHNLHFELEWSALKFGHEIIRAGRWEDSMTQAHVLDERVGGKVCFGLGFLTMQYFGIDIKTLSKLDRKNMINEPIHEILPYNGIDAKYHRLLWEAQHERLLTEGLQTQYELLLRRVPTAVSTQIRGINIDPEETAVLGERYEAEIRRIEDEIFALPECNKFEKLTKRIFKPGAPRDVKIMLKDILHIDPDLFGDDAESTNKNNLAKVDHKFASLIVEYREQVKLKSTYVDAVRDNLWPDGLIHQELQTIFVVTSRASSDSINMKNFPKRDEAAKVVRKQIKARDGRILAAFDYGQIQVRNVAMESRDPVLTKYLWENHDMHGEWASKIAHQYPAVIGGKKFLTDKDVMKAFRNTCKSGWTFCLLFGGQLYTAANHLKIPEKELSGLYDAFWEEFSGVYEWQQNAIKKYKTVGYIENLSGRKRRAPVAQNQLINAPIQADEAEIVWDAFNRLSEKDNPVYQPINEIYDDLTLELPLHKLDNHIETVLDEMLKCTFEWINVPLVVELSVSPDWADLVELGKYDSVSWHGTPKRPEYA